MSTFLTTTGEASALSAGESPGPVNREIVPPIELGLPYWFHLFFPERQITTDLKILVAGGENLSLRLARANPRARIVAVEQRADVWENLTRAKGEHGLANLELIATWPPPGQNDSFDLVYDDARCWPDEPPRALLERSTRLLRPNGALHLTLPAKHAWAGVRAVGELLQRLGVEANSEGYPKAREIVSALGPKHLWNLLGPVSRGRPDDLLADWLRPEDPTFSVTEMNELLAASSLRLQRFTYQAYYLPQCSPMARTSLIDGIRRLPPLRQQVLMEFYWPAVREHLLIACRADRPSFDREISFDGVEWLNYVPLLPSRLPIDEESSTIGAKARLSWRATDMPEIGAALGGFQFRLLKALERAEKLGDAVGLASLSGDPELRDQWARDFFRMMWEHDFLHFRTGQAVEESVSPAVAEEDVSSALEAMASELEAMSGRIACTAGERDEGSAPLTTPPEIPASENAVAQAAAPERTASQILEEAVSEPHDDCEQPSVANDWARVSSFTDDALSNQLPTLEDFGISRAPSAVPASVMHEAVEPPESVSKSASSCEPGSSQHSAASEFDFSGRIPYEACPVCGESGFEPYREIETEWRCGDRPLQVRIPWMRCFRCAHVFTAGYFAGEDWSQILQAAMTGREVLRQPAALRPQASRIVSTVTTMRERASGSWLDVGCGHSGLVAVAAEFGYESTGIDCCARTAERFRALGFAVRTGSLFDCQKGPLDVISLSGVLDRTPFPAQALRHLHRLMAPNGLLFVSALTSESLPWRIQDLEGNNPHWARLDRYHNFHRKSLFRLLQNTGFAPCHYAASERDGTEMEVIACKS